MRRIRLAIMVIVSIIPLIAAGFSHAAEKQILLRYAGGMSLQHHITSTMEHFAKLVQEKSGNRVKLELYPASELYSHKDLPTAVATGAVDLAEMDTSKMGGLSDAAEMSTMSFLFRDWEHSVRLHNEFGGMVDNELKSNGAKLVFWMPYGQDVAPLTIKRQINTLEDLKGLKIRGIGEISSRWLEAAGASSTFIASPEVYQALATKAIDGAMSGWGSYYDRKWYEAGKYICGQPFNFCMFVTVANLKKWNSLPKDIQDIILQAGKEAQAWELSIVDKKDKEYISLLKQKGMIINYLPEAEAVRWRNLMKPIYKEWGNRSPTCTKIMEQLMK
jgi:TRAP-type C4-dicarboxylate transport system substrate-binding protein